ncbi:hypothetical protein GF337_20185 [candidate division KSB1 bacterium]|nr:hypothetical protein [candidate division KSB1 bacterium]
MKYRIAALAGLLGVCFSTCQISSPEAPGFRIPLKLVLIDSTYTLRDLSKETDQLIIPENGKPEFVIEGAADTFRVQDQLSVDGESYNRRVEMEDYLTINTTMRDSSLRFWDMIPGIEQFSGTYQPIPSFSLHRMRTNSFTVGKINYIVISSGTAEIKVENHLPLTIDSINVRMIDEVFGYIDELQFDAPITPGSSRMAQIDLAGKSVSSELYLEISAVSPGSGGETVYISEKHYIDASMNVRDLKFSEAEAYVESVKYEEDVEIILANNMHIEEARFLSGKAYFNLANHTGMEANISMLFPDIFRENGKPLQLDYTLTIKQKLNTSIDLKNLFFKPPVDYSVSGQKLRVHFLVSTFDYGKEIIHLTDQDWAEVAIDLEDIKFASIAGILNREEININSNISFPELADNFSEIRLKNARLDLQFHNRINFPIETDFALTGIAKSGSRVSLMVQHRIPPGKPDREMKSMVSLSEANSNILNFLSNLPQRIEVSGKAYLGDGVTNGSIEHNDFVNINHELTIPLQVSFAENVINLDTTEIIIEPENYGGDVESDGDVLDAKIMDRFYSGEMEFMVQNHFPVGVDVEMLISRNPGQLFSNPQLKIGPVIMPAGKTDNNGQVIEAAEKINQINLSAEDLDIFKNSSNVLKRLYLCTRIHLHGTNGKMVSVNANDYLAISAVSEFRVEVSE